MNIIIIAALFVIIAETTYLVVSSTNTHTKSSQSPVFVDTSVLIDGRIISIAQSGFLTRPLYIPRSVVGELQLLADGSDSEKRTRARHGLDIIKDLQAISLVETVIFPDGVRADEGVDNRLLALAKKHSGALCTVDYNLNKVADVEGIEVLNINELAKTLRMSYLPGETTRIELTQKGNDARQAVGHLDDGTMVVVENAHKYIGTTVTVEFVRGLQTAAGKMMFAKLVSSHASHSSGTQGASKVKKAPTLTSAKASSSLHKNHNSSRVGSNKSKAEKTVKNSYEKSRTNEKPDTRGVFKEDSQLMTPKTNLTKSSSRRRRTTPEDSLVELANRQ